MRPGIPLLLDLLVPGTGHLVRGERRAGLLFLVPPLLLVVAVVVELLTRGPYGLLAVIVTPGVLPALAVLNVGLAAWRIAAGIDTARRSTWTRRAGAVLGGSILVLVVVPHLVAGVYIASTSDFLDSMFASTPEETSSPSPTDFATPSTSEVAEASPSDDLATDSPEPSGETPAPSATPRRPFVSGTGTLPKLGVAVPWQAPGAVPWGNDGRFDLLLLGSDAGTDRWSRRMDVMILVEIDVATGKVAMVGLPRNLVNAPFPPGAARDAVPCGCFSGLLNALYVEATVSHPDRWPGSGAVKGIGAVRSVVSELTGRPVDAVLVVDLWGMIKVVNAMGGIDIKVPAAVHDDHYPDPVFGSMVLDIRAGQQHMDGRTALAYARSRHQDSDYSRMLRQQTLLLALRSQIGPATILNAPALFTAAKGFSWTDLPRDSLPNLVELFGRAAGASVKQLRIVPARYAAQLTPGEIDQIRADIASLLGPAPQPPPTPTATPTVTPTPAPTTAPTSTITPTATPTSKPSATPTSKPSATPTSQPSPTATPAPTAASPSPVSPAPGTPAPT